MGDYHEGNTLDQGRKMQQSHTSGYEWRKENTKIKGAPESTYEKL